MAQATAHGTAKSTVLFGSICTVAAVMMAVTDDFTVMLVSRFLLGIGSEPLIVAVTTALAKWFKGRELSFAFGLNLTIPYPTLRDLARDQLMDREVEVRDGVIIRIDDLDLEPRKINFASGHREKFWHRNCVAVGMSAGFLEPLEASALVLIELSAGMIADRLPATREAMDITAVLGKWRMPIL